MFGHRTLCQRSFATVRAGIAAPSAVPDVTLNWALAKSGVIPKESSYRNLEPKALGVFSPIVDKKLSFNVSSDMKAPSFVNIKHYNVVMKKILDCFNSQSKLFVADGALGSFTKDAVPVRTITDSAAASQFYRNLLFAVPHRVATAFAPTVTVYHTSSLQLSADDMKAIDVSVPNLLLVNVARQHILVVGQVSGATIQSAVQQLLSQAISAGTAVLLRAHSVDECSTMLINCGTEAGQMMLWSSHGVSTAFGAIVSTMHSVVKPEAGDVVESFKGSKENNLTRAVTPSANLYRAPKAVFLCTSDPSGALPALAQLTPAQARLYFAATASTLTPELVTMAERFAAALTANKTSAYLINESVADAAKLAALVQTGALQSVSCTVLPTLGLSVPAVTGFKQQSKPEAVAAYSSALQARAKATFPKLSLEGSFA